MQKEGVFSKELFRETRGSGLRQDEKTSLGKGGASYQVKTVRGKGGNRSKQGGILTKTDPGKGSGEKTQTILQKTEGEK